jgi:hypothetical protein
VAIKKETGMVEIAMMPNPVDGNNKTDGRLSPSIQYKIMKYFRVLIFLMLTELIKEMLPNAENRKINAVITRNAILKIK